VTGEVSRRTGNGVYAFRLGDHRQRLVESMRLAGLERRFTFEELAQAVTQILPAHELQQDMVVRRFAFCGRVRYLG
jgi:branched-subunit amino acid aminotransferase/4-amino-4-deoxychorismate lyase